MEDDLEEAELEQLKSYIADNVAQKHSIEEVQSWLQSLPCVQAVRLQEYVVKTYPPRRELIMSTAMKGGQIRDLVLSLVISEDDTFEFHEMRCP